MEVQVHGRDAGSGLRAGQALALRTVRFLEAFTLGDLGHRADEPPMLEIRDRRDLAARSEPAHRAVRDERAVLGLKMTHTLHRPAQRAHQGLEVLGVYGREPVVARE